MHLLVIFFLFGLAYGSILHRSGFCFARAAYELFLLRTRDAVDGVMAGLLVATAGFGLVVLTGAVGGADVGRHLLLPPLGLNTLLGGALFGLGMTLAGMCAVGALQRVGEGYVSAWAVLLGILLGALADPFRLPWPLLTPVLAKGLSLTRWLPPSAAFVVTLIAVALIWRGARPAGIRRVPELRADAAKPRRFPLPRLAGSALVGGLMLGVLNTAQMAVSMPWTAGYPLAAIPSVLAPASAAPSLPMLPALLALNGGVSLGALASTALTRELRLRAPRRSRDLVRGLGGGFLMGWGIKLGYGCTLGGFFSAVPSLAVSGWVYLVGLLLGAWAGAKVIAKTA